MGGEQDSEPPRRGIDAAAKATFLAALRRGARREDAAGEAGFSLAGFYGARRRDRAFAAEWAEALAGAPAGERRARAYEERGARPEQGRGARPEQGRGEVRIAPANRRLLQRRRRYVRFTIERQEIYLARLAQDCDSRAAAAAAGVSESTVTLHRRKDRAFAEAHKAALELGYVNLEAEALRKRLAAQSRLRAAIDSAAPAERAPLHAEQAEEFDRTMKLLARFDRKRGRPERGFKPGGRRQEWTFDRAIALIAQRLRGLGIPIDPPAEGEG